MEHGEQSATPGQSEPAKSTPDVWPPPPVGEQRPLPVVNHKPVWLPVTCLVVSCLAATIFGVLVYCFGEGRRGIPVPLMLLSLGSYALVVASLVWLAKR